ncbi:hypothetical protein NE237_020210 [Protea cynaroides]|uniref:Uncharacterized protein n=1 Tax=Protea cynaroides TaxID=273540 RepID=A0A9Q0H6T3_9MAGN|nr:hypothetical protein NE237_020210 [Protea cynaroides]
MVEASGVFQSNTEGARGPLNAMGVTILLDLDLLGTIGFLVHRLGETFEAAGEVPQEQPNASGRPGAILTEDTPRQEEDDPAAADFLLLLMLLPPVLMGSRLLRNPQGLGSALFEEDFEKEYFLHSAQCAGKEETHAKLVEESGQKLSLCWREIEKLKAESERLKAAVDSEKELGQEYQAHVASKDAELMQLRMALGAAETSRQKAEVDVHKAETKAAPAEAEAKRSANELRSA